MKSGCHLFHFQVLNDRGYVGSASDIWPCGVILFVLIWLATCPLMSQIEGTRRWVVSEKWKKSCSCHYGYWGVNHNMYYRLTGLSSHVHLGFLPRHRNCQLYSWSKPSNSEFWTKSLVLQFNMYCNVFPTWALTLVVTYPVCSDTSPVIYRG